MEEILHNPGTFDQPRHGIEKEERRCLVFYIYILFIYIYVLYIRMPPLSVTVANEGLAWEVRGLFSWLICCHVLSIRAEKSASIRSQRLEPKSWICFVGDFCLRCTMVNYHEKPPFGRIVVFTFSKHLKQIQATEMKGLCGCLFFSAEDSTQKQGERKPWKF